MERKAAGFARCRKRSATADGGITTNLDDERQVAATLRPGDFFRLTAA